MWVRKKPIIYEAWVLDEKDSNYPQWVHNAIAEGLLSYVSNRWSIYTREGIMTANDGDVLIRGIYNELWACAKNIFDETYDVLRDTLQ